MKPCTIAVGGTVVSLQVGKPHPLTTAKGTEWRSAIVKQATSERIPLVGENLAGDYQANRKYHGGPDKAVCAYFAAHYPAWRDVLNLPDFGPGAFGENITVDGLTEGDLCIGDTLAVGTTLLQISQPRQPCANISKRWDRPKLPALMQDNGQTGFYCRVLQHGDMGQGDTVVVTERPHDGWTLLRANQLMYDNTADPAEVIALRELPLLSAEWKRILGRKLASS